MTDWPSPCVYLLRSNDLYKIGTTDNLERRLAEFRVGNPHLKVVTAIPGDGALERRLHSIFARRRVVGEWFRLSAEDIVAIQDGRHAGPWRGTVSVQVWPDGHVEVERADPQVLLGRAAVERARAGEEDGVQVEGDIVNVHGLVRYRLVGPDPEQVDGWRAERLP